MKLRPHHLLCTQGYSGKGYSDAFVANMTKMTQQLRRDPNATIELVFSTDDICTCCPKKLGEGLCADNLKVNDMDKKVIAYFGLKPQSYNYHSITQQINTQMTEPMMHDICQLCVWFPISACRRNILQVP